MKAAINVMHAEQQAESLHSLNVRMRMQERGRRGFYQRHKCICRAHGQEAYCTCDRERVYGS